MQKRCCNSAQPPTHICFVFFCLCYGVEWYGEVREMEWHLTDLMSCKSMFFRPLFLSVSWHLMCASHSPGLWFLMLCIAAEWETVKFFSFHSICFSYFSSLCVCVSFNLTWLTLLCLCLHCVWPYVCKKKRFIKISNLLQKPFNPA